MRLSGLVVFKNEERFFLKECLLSMLSVCDEVVAIDTGSTDGSVRMVSDLNDGRIRLLVKDWAKPQDYSNIKNWGITQCKGEWILSMDADEVLDDAFGSLLSKLGTEGVDVWGIEGRHYINHLAQEDSTVSPHVWARRLFRNNGRIFYSENLMHSLPSGFQKEGVIGFGIHHYGYVKNQCFNLWRFESNMKKLEIHTPLQMASWFKSHVSGSYPVKPVSLSCHPGFVQKKFYFRVVGL